MPAGLICCGVADSMPVRLWDVAAVVEKPRPPNKMPRADEAPVDFGVREEKLELPAKAREAWQTALKRHALDKALKTELSVADREALAAFGATHATLPVAGDGQERGT